MKQDSADNPKILTLTDLYLSSCVISQLLDSAMHNLPA